MAQGRLDIQIEVKGRDELSQLLSGCATTRRPWCRWWPIRDTASELMSASAEIAGASGELASRTERTAASLEESAAAVEQITATAYATSDQAAQAAQVATQNAGEATRSGEVIGDMVQTMNSIHQGSKRIADIIGVIDGIAFQTNILALNARWKRPGPGQGRGFAVVASEVRALAQRSRRPRAIKTLIGQSVEQVGTGRGGWSARPATPCAAWWTMPRRSASCCGHGPGRTRAARGPGGERGAVRAGPGGPGNAMMVEESATSAQRLRERAGRLNEAVARRAARHGGPDGAARGLRQGRAGSCAIRR